MVICGCGNEAKIKTSWTDRNPVKGSMVAGSRVENVLEEDLEDHVFILREKEQMIMKLRLNSILGFNLQMSIMAGIMDIHDEIEFKIHKNGYFEFHPLRYGSIRLFVAHKQERLAEYYLNNIGLDGTDGEVVGCVEEDASFFCSSSTPFMTRQKEGKVNEDKEVLVNTNKVVVTNYGRGFDSGKATMIEDVGVVNKKRQVQQRPSGIVIKEGGLMNVQVDVGVINNKQQTTTTINGYLCYECQSKKG
ncbi:hypothetical protein Tco_0111901 [Tanacetum coccineum]